MTSSYSPDLRLELMATGDQSGTWGTTTNTNLGTLLEQAICGVLSVAEGDTTLTLTAVNGGSDQSRNATVILTGAMTAQRNVVVPTANKSYIVQNSTTGGFAVNVTTSGGTGSLVPPGQSRWVYCDGVNVVGGLVGYRTESFATTPTAGGTTTLTSASFYIQKFTGTTAQTVVLPVTSTLFLGKSYEIRNRSTNPLTVQSSGANLIQKIQGGQIATLTCVSISGTGAASWDTQTPVSRQRTNREYNPACEVSVQNGTTLGTTTGYFATDNCALYFTAATAAMSVQQIAGPTINGSAHQVEYKCTTSKASLGGSDSVTLTTKIEGLNAADLQYGTANAVSATRTFLFSGPAGTYNVHGQNQPGNRHIAIPFTPTAANTPENITVVIPGDTGGTWTVNNDTLITLDIVLAAGATITGGSASTWSGSTYFASATQKNILDNTANVVRTGDFIFAPDPDNTGVAPPWVPVDIRKALSDCQRYLPAINSTAAGTAAIGTISMFGGNTVIAFIVFPVPARTPPTGIAYSNLADFQVNPGAASSGITALVFSSASSLFSNLVATNTNTSSTGFAGTFFMLNTTGKLLFTGSRMT